MDENGDAPEHPAVRWYQRQSSVEQFTILIATVLFGCGVFFAALSFALLSEASPASELLDRLGWSLIQLGGAIAVVQVVLHKKELQERSSRNEVIISSIIQKYRILSPLSELERLAKNPRVKEKAQINLDRNMDFKLLDKCQYELIAGSDHPEIIKIFDDCNSLLKSELGLVLCLKLNNTLLGESKIKHTRISVEPSIEKAQHLLDALVERHPKEAIRFHSLRLNAALQQIRLNYLEASLTGSSDSAAP